MHYLTHQHKYQNIFDNDNDIAKKPRTAMDFSSFYALSSRDNKLLSGYLDITKVVFSW